MMNGKAYFDTLKSHQAISPYVQLLHQQIRVSWGGMVDQGLH